MSSSFVQAFWSLPPSHRFFASCSVSVLPPWASERCVTSYGIARMRPMTSMPEFFQ